MLSSLSVTSASLSLSTHHQILGKKIRKKYYVVESVRHTSANLSLSITPSDSGEKDSEKILCCSSPRHYVVESVRHTSAKLSLSITPSVLGKKIRKKNFVVESVRHLGIMLLSLSVTPQPI
jgi:hypothetical protein